MKRASSGNQFDMSLQKFVRRDPEILKVKVLEARVRFSLPPPEVDVRHLDSALEREILSSSTATDLFLRSRTPSWIVVESSPPPPWKAIFDCGERQSFTLCPI